jgi:hypothetical protein
MFVLSIVFVFTSSVFGQDVIENIGIKNLTLKPIEVISPPPERYLLPENIRYQTGPSITISKGGRLWVTIMTGGRNEDIDNYVDLITSGNGGKTWTQPIFALDIPGPMRTFDPAIWTDPNGTVWWFWCQVYSMWDGRGGLWAMTCDNPDKVDAQWSPPRRLCDGVMKNKPIVTSKGEWWLLVEQWQWNTPFGWNLPNPLPEWFHKSEYIGANVYASTNYGKNWQYLSTAKVPTDARTCDEHMVVELADGSFRMLLRTQYGIGESLSNDNGRTWTDVVPSKIRNPSSRFFFARLVSGNILLIKNGQLDTKTSRKQITAFLSEDDGQTFPYSLVLDPREGVSYPDACQDIDESIYAVHDYDRTGKGEIILDHFTEEDIKAGKIVSEKGQLQQIIRKNGK